ncbi:uncharacterized protein N0V89_005880 [Didymosphaeria variabile]|uniref:Peptidase S8/S53 domain-containing protein n=1 Tax=Didymosphaeria variabile TaxID=1932322 RepID=A0A9W8XLJ3_9PLEO|nr:uncharacterized protein N0V89_005880 [Didymosphaeria variabile]KAJ4354147.1 hypothetical protein N0V89_005880 [Didymosphaeria variabile]
MRSFINFLPLLPAVFAGPLVIKPERIPGSWIFKVHKDSVLETVIQDVSVLFPNIKPTHTYSFGDFKGFCLDGVPSTTGLQKRIDGIEFIEANTQVYATALTTQVGATWGLGRISHRNRGNNNYVYDLTAGQGSFAYVIDTGIRTTHNDFQGRAVWGNNFAGDKIDTDANGHGTHVAGTIGSRTYGVAKRTTLVAVKVLDATGSGSLSNVIAGIQWAIQNATDSGRIGRAVANLSLGGPTTSSATNAAVAEAVRAGLFVAVAAGNDAQSASLTSPASEPTVCTVGATDRNDVFASFSNYGSLVDILAPGVDIMSTWYTTDNATAVLSGTSMATPHVAGLGAYLLTLEGPRTPEALCQRIKALSTKNKVTFRVTQWLARATTNNTLAYNGNGS